MIMKHIVLRNLARACLRACELSRTVVIHSIAGKGIEATSIMMIVRLFIERSVKYICRGQKTFTPNALRNSLNHFNKTRLKRCMISRMVKLLHRRSEN